MTGALDAAATFPPGTVIADAAEKLLHSLNRRLGHTSEAAERVSRCYCGRKN